MIFRKMEDTQVLANDGGSGGVLHHVLMRCIFTHRFWFKVEFLAGVDPSCDTNNYDIHSCHLDTPGASSVSPRT